MLGPMMRVELILDGEHLLAIDENLESIVRWGDGYLGQPPNAWPAKDVEGFHSTIVVLPRRARHIASQN